jgi:DNA-binding response OmpR family regulator
MDTIRVLVVDDDPDILTILRDHIEMDGYDVTVADTGKKALDLFRKLRVDLVVLDLGLPDLDGVMVCRTIRKTSDAPIIMLTARDRVTDKVLGLESGADDYVVKPFEYIELSARIKACLRRRRPESDSPPATTLGDVSLDKESRVVRKNGAPVSLTRREFELLVLLTNHAGQVLSRAAIRRALWPDGDVYEESRAIDVHIQHLRAKIEEDPQDPKRIKTVQGAGYMFVPRVETKDAGSASTA